MAGQEQSTLVLTADDVRRALTRLAHEVLERNQGAERLILIGILGKGVPLAERLAGLIQQFEGVEIPVGRLDVALYRDDVRARHPEVRPTDVPVDITDRIVVLVDEVFYTGRTARAAMDAVMDFGRPAEIQPAVLIDRGHRELPIRPDYVGKNLPTSRDEHVRVTFRDGAVQDAVYIDKGPLPERSEARS